MFFNYIFFIICRYQKRGQRLLTNLQLSLESFLQQDEDLNTNLCCQSHLEDGRHHDVEFRKVSLVEWRTPLLQFQTSHHDLGLRDRKNHPPEVDNGEVGNISWAVGQPRDRHIT